MSSLSEFDPQSAIKYNGQVKKGLYNKVHPEANEQKRF